MYGNWNRHAAILPSAYVSAVERAGGIPMIIPPAGDMTGLMESNGIRSVMGMTYSSPHS